MNYLNRYVFYSDSTKCNSKWLNYHNYYNYKQYIFDENYNKAILMANKYTGELAYVFNNEVICKDIEKYKLNTSTKNRLNKLIAS